MVVLHGEELGGQGEEEKVERALKSSLETLVLSVAFSRGGTSAENNRLTYIDQTEHIVASGSLRINHRCPKRGLRASVLCSLAYEDIVPHCLVK